MQNKCRGYLEITVNTLETIVLPYVLIRSLNLNLADLIFVLVIGCFMLKSRSMRSGIVARSIIGKTSCNQSTELSKIESADLIKTKINDYIQLGCDIFVSFLPTHTIAKCFISLSVSHVPKHSIPLELRQLCLPCPLSSRQQFELE